jgi:hypothetical protein
LTLSPTRPARDVGKIEVMLTDTAFAAGRNTAKIDTRAVKISSQDVRCFLFKTGLLSVFHVAFCGDVNIYYKESILNFTVCNEKLSSTIYEMRTQVNP